LRRLKLIRRYTSGRERLRARVDFREKIMSLAKLGRSKGVDEDH